jgi:hypothetical protein
MITEGLVFDRARTIKRATFTAIILKWITKEPKCAGRVPEMNMFLKYIQGLTNIPPDADTTSVTYTAQYFDPAHERKADPSGSSEGALDTFSTFRDLNRTSHYYNKLDGISNSGAFMTWFIDEKSKAVPQRSV